MLVSFFYFHEILFYSVGVPSYKVRMSFRQLILVFSFVLEVVVMLKWPARLHEQGHWMFSFTRRGVFVCGVLFSRTHWDPAFALILFPHNISRAPVLQLSFSLDVSSLSLSLSLSLLFSLKREGGRGRGVLIDYLQGLSN